MTEFKQGNAVVLHLPRGPFAGFSDSWPKVLRHCLCVSTLSANELAGLRSIADQIEAQTAPSRPAEPQGLGAVVKDVDGRRWVRLPVEHLWASENGLADRRWGLIDSPTVLSEGVKP